MCFCSSRCKYNIMKLKIKRQCTLICLTILLVLVITANLYFIYIIVDEKPSHSILKNDKKITAPTTSSKSTGKLSNNEKLIINQETVKIKSNKQDIHNVNRTASEIYKKRILQYLSNLPDTFNRVNDNFNKILEQTISDLIPKNKLNPSQAWVYAEQWVTNRYVVPENASLLGSVLRALTFAKIIKAYSAKEHGTQLKIMFILEGGQKAVFKPQWYSREHVIEGPVYAGKDRHNAEIAAFHLGLLLGFRRSPLVVGRRVNLRKEVMPVADRELMDTFYQEGNNTCLYGICHYCGPHDPVCAIKDQLEGALVLWLPPKFKLKKVRHPWQRTYREAVPARWEAEIKYCDRVKASKFYGNQKSRLLDLVDSCILDFLIDNGDRHHYELIGNTTDSAVLLLDNGKSFGNPSTDHIDILAPLYQCCMLRRSTWERLLLFTGEKLSYSLEKILNFSRISPILSKQHLSSIDRRLKIIFATILLCNSDYESILV